MSWESQGAKSRLAVSTSASMTNVNSVWLEMISENLLRNEQILNPGGSRGTRSQASERNVRGPRAPAGTIVLPLSIVALDNLLPACLGAAEVSDAFDTAEPLPAIYLLIDKLTEVFLASEAYVNRWRISGTSGGLCELTLEVECEDLIGGQTFPAATTSFRPDTSAVFQMADTDAITLNSAARNFLAFEVSGDNQLTTSDFTQGLTRDGTIAPEDRIITASFDLLATPANADLRERAAGGENVVLTLTHGESDDEVEITLGRLAYVDPIATIDRKGRKVIRVQGPVRAVGHPGVAGFVPDIRFTVVAGA